MRALATAVLLLTLASGCAHPPRTSYTFDPAPGAWELGGHADRDGAQHETYVHDVHGERLDIWEVRRPAPAGNSREFAALPAAQRVLPPLGTATSTPHALGDEEFNGRQGYWVEQTAQDSGDAIRAAVFVIPSGRRHFVVRMRSSEDDTEQLRAWLTDTVMRNFTFPPPEL